MNTVEGDNPTLVAVVDQARRKWLRREELRFNSPAPGLETGWSNRAFEAGFVAGMTHAKANNDHREG